MWGLVLHVGLVTSYQFSCPDQSQRRFLQQNCPSSTPHYTCLFNVISKRPVANCSSREYLARDGIKKIRMPGVTDGNCTENRYQPTTFSASQLSECMYLKSGCEEEGQVVVFNGTGSQDRSCRCDYRAGYTYVIPPRNPCACVPSEEDCSCRKMYCNQNEFLSPDYKCEKTGGLFLTVCKSISITTAPPGDKGIDLDHLDPLPLSNTPSNISGSKASVGVLLLLLVVILVVTLLWLRVCPDVQSYSVNFEKTNHVLQRDDVHHKYTVINGCDIKLTLTYKSLLPIRPINLREVGSGQILEGVEERGEPNTGYRLRGVKETSYHVSNVQSTSTGTYDIIIINMISLPSSLMGWWSRCHGRLATFIYNRGDKKTNTSTSKTELNIVSSPEMYNPKDIMRGKAVTLELKANEYTLVSWLRLDDNDQLSVVNNDSTQPDKRQKYTGGVSSNPSLTINQTCMGDGGRYCCFGVSINGDMTAYGWKLRVIPQEHGYQEMKDHRSDTEYVRISVVSTASDCLERNGVVVIKGREGTGKTKLALELASMWEEKGYLPVIVRSEDDIKKEFDESNILYIFDHSNRNEQYWIDKLSQCLQGKQSGLTCKAVFMVRNFMFRPLKELKIKDVVDLDSGLLEDDKLSILSLYMRKNNVATVGTKESNFNQQMIIEDPSVQVKLDKGSVAMIIKTEPFWGFPLTAKKFCASRSHLQLGEKYFRNPPEDVIQEIKILGKDARKELASLHEALLVVVLAYITSSDQRLNINYINYEMFRHLKTSLLGDRNDKQKLPFSLDVEVKEAIQKAADSLVVDYLTCSDGVYEFIHPYYAKAVVLSLHEFAPIIVHYDKLELVLEYVRGEREQKDDTVVRLAKIYYPELCERLINAFSLYSTLSNEDKTCDQIGNYIYDYWIKDRDVKFCSNLISLLEKQVFGERKLEDKVLPLHVFSLLTYMTYNWNDMWIYSAEIIHDVLIIYGLLAMYNVKTKNVVSSADVTDTNVRVHPHAAQDTVIVDKMQFAVNMLITKLKERLNEANKSKEKDTFIRKLVTPLDQRGNTFFHYLILYEDEELACNIFNECSKYVKKEWTALNAKEMHSIDFAVAFGRPKLCNAFIRNKFLKEWIKKNKERLKAIQNHVQSGETKLAVKKDKNDAMVIDLNENFHPDVANLVLRGSEEDYKALADILYKL